MKVPELVIRKSELLRKPCEDYNDLPEEFEAIEEIRKRGNNPSHLRWLITYCPKAQTKKMLDYFKILKPNCTDVRWLIENCKFAQNKISLYPSYHDVVWLIENCEFAKTPEMLEYLKYLK
jgi:hypothetical protein